MNFDRIRECSAWGNEPGLRDKPVEAIIVHQHGTDGAPDKDQPWPDLQGAEDLAIYHSTHSELVHVTGRLPYGFAVTRYGAIEQGISLRHYGCGAMDWSALSVEIAVLGDLRTGPATLSQMRALLVLCNTLHATFGAQVLGHSEAHELGKPRRRATTNPHKVLGGSEQCPGSHLDLDEVRRHAYEPGARSLSELGIVR